MMDRFFSYTNSDKGVATVDWFVLTVGAFSLGFAMLSAAMVDADQISTPTSVVFVSDTGAGNS